MRPIRTSIVWIIGGVALVGLLLWWSSRITTSTIEGDAAQTLTMALNLRHHGIVSLDAEPPYRPSMYREPVPVLTTSLAIAAVDAAYGPAANEAYAAGQRARFLKFQNLFWAGLLTVAAAWATYLLTSSRVLALAGGAVAALGAVPFAADGVESLGLDSLATDLAAAAGLMLGSALLLHGWRTRRWAHFALAGAAFGVLALVKAAFFYVFIVFAAILAVLAVVDAKAAPRLRWGPVVALLAAFLAVVVPWMTRNYVSLGHFQLAERAGIVLLVRATKDGMSGEEAKGALYAWAPAHLQPAIGRLLGFSRNDLLRGGRLQRLNRTAGSDFYADDVAAEEAGMPENAISFYRRARAERVNLVRLAREQAGPEAERLVDQELQRRAVALIRQDPLRHLAMTPLFIWRGAFVAFPVLLLALLYAVWRRDHALGLFVLPGFGLVMFYALLSHFIPRYGAPVLPFVVVCGLTLAARAAAALRVAHSHELSSNPAHAAAGGG